MDREAAAAGPRTPVSRSLSGIWTPSQVLTQGSSCAGRWVWCTVKESDAGIRAKWFWFPKPLCPPKERGGREAGVWPSWDESALWRASGSAGGQVEAATAALAGISPWTGLAHLFQLCSGPSESVRVRPCPPCRSGSSGPRPSAGRREGLCFVNRDEVPGSETKPGSDRTSTSFARVLGTQNRTPAPAVSQFPLQSRRAPSLLPCQPPDSLGTGRPSQNPLGPVLAASSILDGKRRCATSPSLVANNHRRPTPDPTFPCRAVVAQARLGPQPSRRSSRRRRRRGAPHPKQCLAADRRSVRTRNPTRPRATSPA